VRHGAFDAADAYGPGVSCTVRIGRHPEGYGLGMSPTLLWVLAVILVIVGIIMLVQGQWILGIALILAGLLVGPGGVSVFRSGRRAR
jgi:hypothetical protein